MYARPATLESALEHLAEGDWSLLAGGTDFYPARVGRPLNEPVLDISGVAGLRGIDRTDEGFSIGALTTWTDVIRADLPPAFDALKLAAREVGSIQVQNAGTVAGNLCNASPAADGVPPLLVLDAEVEAMSGQGVRRLPLTAFIRGNRQTALGAGEMVTRILIPGSALKGHSTFLKLGARKYLVISIVMVAARLGEGDAAVAVGSCSAVAQRLRALEADLRGGVIGVRPEHLSPLSPIDDMRADATYRGEAAAALVQRAVDAVRA
ncbi:FAD binding domain-containing protein [Minwuia sp.]|uniref:FAD binding domain-containing protein n=1 Tax=Minwuia sp. TaxID=2493630 RepID=UPI003A8EF328